MLQIICNVWVNRVDWVVTHIVCNYVLLGLNLLLQWPLSYRPVLSKGEIKKIWNPQFNMFSVLSTKLRLKMYVHIFKNGQPKDEKWWSRNSSLTFRVRVNFHKEKAMKNHFPGLVETFAGKIWLPLPKNGKHSKAKRGKPFPFSEIERDAQFP